MPKIKITDNKQSLSSQLINNNNNKRNMARIPACPKLKKDDSDSNEMIKIKLMVRIMIMMMMMMIKVMMESDEDDGDNEKGYDDLLCQNANLTYPTLTVYTPGPGFDVMKFN